LGGLGDLPKRPDDRACVEKKIKEEKLKWADKKDWAGNGLNFGLQKFFQILFKDFEFKSKCFKYFQSKF
jgi:hypothetical protein